MNPDTLVTVCCYSGDVEQVKNLMPYYRHHDCPVVVLSPQDHPVSDLGGIICRTGGKKAYIGQESLDRQALHMKMMLDYPFKWFLMHDSDSVCLAPQLPEYLYKRDDVVWSNEVFDFHERPRYVMPRIAMQPPYFASRKMMEAMVRIAPQIRADPLTPFIDHYFVQLVCRARLHHHTFPDGNSFGTHDDNGAGIMERVVRDEGKIFMHSVKRPEVISRIVNARSDYVATHS